MATANNLNLELSQDGLNATKPLSAGAERLR